VLILVKCFREDLVQARLKFGNPLPRHVFVLRSLQLGDMLCAVPAFRALRRALPEAEIVLVGLPWAEGFATRFRTYLDGFRAFPGYPGLPERPAQLEEIPPFLAGLQQERFDLAIQMHGAGTVTNPLTVLFGAKANAGYFVHGQFCPDEARFLPYPEDLPEVRRHLRLAEFLGATPQGENLEFPVGEEDRRELQAVAGGLEAADYVCLHLGSKSARRWPAERFAAVGEILAERGLRVVLTGSEVEKPLTAAVAQALTRPALDLAGRTTLGALGALLQGARLLISNDTGVAHLAVALRLPSVVLFHPSPLARWGPLDRRRHRALAFDSEPAAVLREADDLLRGDSAE
jgi:ADP-heptose:LPS heptosyltransferase